MKILKLTTILNVLVPTKKSIALMAIVYLLAVCLSVSAQVRTSPLRRLESYTTLSDYLEGSVLRSRKRAASGPVFMKAFSAQPLSFYASAASLRGQESRPEKPLLPSQYKKIEKKAARTAGFWSAGSAVVTFAVVGRWVVNSVGSSGDTLPFVEFVAGGAAGAVAAGVVGVVVYSVTKNYYKGRYLKEAQK